MISEQKREGTWAVLEARQRVSVAHCPAPEGVEARASKACSALQGSAQPG